MKTVIGGIRDTLDQRVAEFSQTPLKQSVLINSVPKGGTHLLRNILRMFVPVEQHYHHEFIQLPILREHGRSLMSDPPYLVCGHLIFSEESSFMLHRTRHILLVRDPYEWVLARARFYLSGEFQQSDLEILKTGFVPVSDLLNLMIVGSMPKIPSLLDMYTLNAVAWFGTDMHLVRYEEAAAAVKDLSSPKSEAFFMALFAAAGIDPPANWRERVEIGADRRQSRTARENLNLPKGMVIPDELPEAQKRLVDFSAPGLRAFLGYT